MQDLEEHEAGITSSPRRVGVLLAAVVAVAVVLFSLGVMVGKKARVPAPVTAEPPSALPTETLVPLAPEDLPKKKISDSGVDASGEGEAHPGKLTFFDRLSGEKAQDPALPGKPEGSAAPAVRRVEKKAAAGSGDDSRREKGAEKAPEKKPAAPTPAARVTVLSSGGDWAVQVSSGTNRTWSDEYVVKLKKRGLDARSVPVMLDGKRWYRIRIGRFPDRTTALEARKILESAFDLKGNVVQGD